MLWGLSYVQTKDLDIRIQRAKNDIALTLSTIYERGTGIVYVVIELKNTKFNTPPKPKLLSTCDAWKWECETKHDMNNENI